MDLDGYDDDTVTLNELSMENEDDDDDTQTLAGDSAGSGIEEFMSDSTFVLTLERDDPRETRFYTQQGRTMYNVLTRPQSTSVANQASKALVTTLRNQTEQVASYTRPAKQGFDMIAFESEKPRKRTSWLTSGKMFSKDIGVFKHQDKIFRWVSKKEQNGLTLELMSSDEPEPVARFLDSRRDWSAPLPTIVIQKARLELQPAALVMIDVVVFSFLVTELMRRERTPTSLSIRDATAKAYEERPAAFFTI